MNHEFYMRRCLELAAKGEGLVAPNPLVGCVIVYNELIVAEGFHHGFGGPHAEVNAINQMKDRYILPECTVYINLEPCSHFGKTPPCANMLVLLGVTKVVVAALDPNPLVAGKGIDILKGAGVDVVIGICEQEALTLNKYFYTFHQKKRPYITLKWAETSDGFIGKFPNDKDFNQSKKISGKQSHIFAHKLRAFSSAILVGGNTVRSDNPELTTRLWPGSHPLRIIVSKTYNFSRELNIFNDQAKTIVYCENIPEIRFELIDYFEINFAASISHQIVQHLYDNFQVQHLLVEGGSQILQTFYDAKLFDEIYIIKSKSKCYQNGIKAIEVSDSLELIDEWEDDLIYNFNRD